MMRKLKRWFNNTGFGSFMMRSTVRSSIFFAEATPCTVDFSCEFADSTRSIENTTSSAVNGAPS